LKFFTGLLALVHIVQFCDSVPLQKLDET